MSRARGSGNIAYLFTDSPEQKEVAKEDILNRLAELIKHVKNGTLDSILIAGFSPDENATVLTGYSNLNLCERMTLIGHLQTDLFLDIAKVNCYGG